MGSKKTVEPAPPGVIMMRFFKSLSPVILIIGCCFAIGIIGGDKVRSFAAQNSQSELAHITSDLPFPLQIQLPSIPDRVVKITDFGAVGDGRAMNTDAFAKAIDACAKAGGGKVIVPAGIWLTGPIQLKSNINLHLE